MNIYLHVAYLSSNCFRSICELGDGTTQWDAMRIPSTKRICFVGQSGSVTPHLEEFIEEKRKKANKGFVPRDVSEELRRVL